MLDNQLRFTGNDVLHGGSSATLNNDLHKAKQ
jgi:hypothetical protein